MNDTDFEKHLRSLLRPMPPSPELRVRIEENLETRLVQPRAYAGLIPRPKHNFLQVLLRDFGWACAGATAAVVACMAFLPLKRTTPSVAAKPAETSETVTQSNTFEHDETTHELVSTENSDQLIETDDGPAREVRYTYVERQSWSNPHTGARVVLEVPREDVYLLPVSLQ